jgi:ankyrin repeat protein
MFNKLFKKYTREDLLEELRNSTFKDSKADSILKDVDIHYKDEFNKSYLHIVAEENLVESVKWLVSKKVNINATDSEGDTALICAARKGSTQTVRTLLQLKADPNITNSKGRTAIQEAVKFNKKDSYVLLKEKTKNLDNPDEEGYTLIFDAIHSQNLDLVKDVIKLQGNSIDKKILFYPDTYLNTNVLKFLGDYIDLNITDEKGRTPLFYLVQNGALNVDSFNFAIEKGANINHIDDEGNNVLLVLIQEILKINPREKETIKNLLDMIPWLIDEHVDYNHCNNNGDNALMLATKNRNIKLVETLLEYEVDPNFINDRNETALALAAIKGKSNIDLVSLLLDYGARPNISDENGKTIIEKLLEVELFLRNRKKLKMKARQNINENENYKSVLEEILLNGEVNLTMLNSQGNPYFFDAVEYGNIDLVKMLVKYGADINLKNKDGYNIIYYYMSKNISFRRVAEQQNYLVMLRNIITLGADVNSRDDYGGITLHKAILDNDIQTIKVLINAGADINAVDNKGRNMVHNAMWQNKVKVFRLLYSYNKNLINKPDKFGVLPINYAAFLGYNELVIELIDSGSYVNNPYKKTHYIFNFLKKFHKNLRPLLENTRNPADHLKMKTLVENMVKEFSVKL